MEGSELFDNLAIFTNPRLNSTLRELGKKESDSGCALSEQSARYSNKNYFLDWEKLVDLSNDSVDAPVTAVVVVPQPTEEVSSRRDSNYFIPDLEKSERRDSGYFIPKSAEGSPKLPSRRSSREESISSYVQLCDNLMKSVNAKPRTNDVQTSTKDKRHRRSKRTYLLSEEYDASQSSEGEGVTVPKEFGRRPSKQMSKKSTHSSRYESRFPRPEPVKSKLLPNRDQ